MSRYSLHINKILDIASLKTVNIGMIKLKAPVFNENIDK